MIFTVFSTLDWAQFTSIKGGTPLIFDLFISEFLSPGKCTMMLFVSAENFKQDEVSFIFKQIYDGIKKSYPNRYMLLYMPFQDMTNSTPEFRTKIAFNHEQYLWDEALLSIGGLNNLNTSIALRNGKSITIRTLLQSIPATEGMTRPQLFQTVEPNAASIITLVTYQAEDSELVAVRQSLLKSELRQIIADNEEDKLFTNPEEGIWFGTVTKSKSGLFTFNKAVTKESIEYSSHFNRIMHSPQFIKMI
jgi:hypothetical protein